MRIAPPNRRTNRDQLRRVPEDKMKAERLHRRLQDLSRRRDSCHRLRQQPGGAGAGRAPAPQIWCHHRHLHLVRDNLCNLPGMGCFDYRSHDTHCSRCSLLLRAYRGRDRN